MASHGFEISRSLRRAIVLSAWVVLGVGCDDAAQAPSPTQPATSAPSASASPSPSASAAGEPAAPTAAKPPETRELDDKWFWVSRGGHELGVVEVLAGRPWRVVLHCAGEDARALEKLVLDHGAAPLSLKMHLPEKEGERGPLGSAEIPPGDELYAFAVEERLERSGFDVHHTVPRFENEKPPASVSKLEFSRDGAKVGTLDLSLSPPKLELVNREGNALFLETFWKGLETEDPLTVSYLSSKSGKEALTTVSAKKGSPDYARQVHLAFAVRYPSYSMVVTP